MGQVIGLLGIDVCDISRIMFLCDTVNAYLTANICVAFHTL